MADVVREESHASKPDDEGSTHSTSRKDTTQCTLAFRGAGYHLHAEAGGKSDAEISAMRGRDVILTIAGLRDKLDHIMDTLDVTQIPSSVSRDTVDAAVALG